MNPADYVRGMPITSNKFEMVETWQERKDPDGSRHLVTQVTFYDPIGLVKPQSAVYTHDCAPGPRGGRRAHPQLAMRVEQ